MQLSEAGWNLLTWTIESLSAGFIYGEMLR